MAVRSGSEALGSAFYNMDSGREMLQIVAGNGFRPLYLCRSFVSLIFKCLNSISIRSVTLIFRFTTAKSRIGWPSV